MDEPFSQVDALTAENLRGEVVRFWNDKATNPKTIFMVSHDVKEVVFMATRIVVMGAKPGRVRRIIENRLPFPRDYRAPAFQRLVDEIHAVITETEIPDVTPPATATPSRAPIWESLPDAGASEVVGLLEVLDDHGGRADVFHLVEHVGHEFGHLLAVVKAAEMLDLVDTPKQDVVLTGEGKQFLAADVPGRKVIFRDHAKALRIVHDVLTLIERADRHEIDEDVILSSLAVRVPYENPERMLQTLVNWGRHADLFDHDPLRGKLFTEPARSDAGGVASDQDPLA
jgi:NitT/TauT family transport system ATP-binding protein